MTARPSEPWRYGCSRCGSTNWRTVVTENRYHCYRCADSFDRLRDRKTGDLVAAFGEATPGGEA